MINTVEKLAKYIPINSISVEFQNGDYFKADVLNGKYKDEYTRDVAVRKLGYFDIRNADCENIAQGVSYKYWHLYKNTTATSTKEKKEHPLHLMNCSLSSRQWKK